MMIVTVFFTPVCTILGRFFPPSLHQRLVAFHAEHSLRSPCIFEVFDLLLADPTSKARCAEGLVTGQDGKILDLVPTRAAAVGTVVADQGAVAEEEQVGVRIEEGLARVAAKTVNVPSIAGWKMVSISITHRDHDGENVPSSNAFPSSKIYTPRTGLAIGAKVRERCS